MHMQDFDINLDDYSLPIHYNIHLAVSLRGVNTILLLSPVLSRCSEASVPVFLSLHLQQPRDCPLKRKYLLLTGEYTSLRVDSTL